MNYNETLDYIHSLGNFSLPPGLDRIKSVLGMLGNPQNAFRSVHIAGTNGKGSVSVMISSVLERAGFKTGLFVSPFIIDFRERIQINGNYISQGDLVRLSEKVIAAKVPLSEFEFITAVAFLYFAESGCDIAVCETGLGGRLDATNVLERKAVAVITKIGLDHTPLLGNTLSEIAYEKCGILRACPTVTNPFQLPEAMSVIAGTAKKLILPDTERLQILPSENLGNTYIYKGKRYDLSLCGGYQVENAITATEAVIACEADIPYNIMYEGLRAAKIPARAEIISEKPLTVLDGAHNPDGAAALADELSKLGDNTVAVIGMMKDKAYDEVLRITLRHCKAAVAVEVRDMPRSLTAQQLKTAAEKYCECITAEDYSSAIALSRKIAAQSPVAIFGSLYLASGIRRELKPLEYKNLNLNT